MYEITEEYLFKPRKIRIAIIGFGFSGISLAYKIQRNIRLGNLSSETELVIYEKNDGVGGTWFENRYPGCACDVPSHLYNFSFAPNPTWSRYYSSATEIHAYLQSVVDMNGLGKYLKLKHRLIGCKWNNDSGKWKIELETGGGIIQDECEMLVTATGCLNKWKWPDIPGIEKFENKMHSARWNESLDFKSKSVAVIGTGASAIQIIPNIYPHLAKLVCFVRSPTWISSGYGKKFTKGEDGRNYIHSEDELKRFAEDPEHYLQFRKKIAQEMNRLFSSLENKSPLQKQLFDEFSHNMRHRLGGNAQLAELLTPTWGVGCRRLTPGENYLETLVKENTEVVSSPIECVTPKGIKTADGAEFELDVIVCATGFDVSFRPAYPIIGLEGRNLRDEWEHDPTGYLATCVSGYPNYFSFLGPNAPVGHGSLLKVIEVTADYILKMACKIERENIKSLNVRQKPQDDYNIHTDAFMPRMVWASACRSWYKSETTGRLTALYPGSPIHWFETMENPRYEDFDIKYLSDNTFQYLGNGYTKREMEGGDLSYFLDIGMEETMPPEVKTNGVV